jgi:aubergine-like protein
LFKGATVITKYGKIKTYRIEDIDYDLSPESSFFSDKEAGKITYSQYYAKCYGIKTLNKKQPLIHTIRRIEKVIENGKIVEKPIYVYLIPELVSLTGMSDADRSNHNAMKEIAPYTKLEPKQRADENAVFIKKFN